MKAVVMQTLFEIGFSNAVLATLLAAIAITVAKLCRRPPVVYWVWMLVLLKLVTPPIVQFPVGPLVSRTETQQPLHITASVPDTSDGLPLLPGLSVHLPHDSEAPAAADLIPLQDATLPPREIVSSPPDYLLGSAGKRQITTDWLSIVVLAWMSGSVALFAMAAYRVVRFGRLLRQATTTASWLEQEAQQLANKLGLSRCPRICVVDGQIPPLLWAMGLHPVIVLPRELLERLSQVQQSTLLAHELAHFRRGDHWIRWFEIIVLGIYWWHPVAWLARRKLVQAEEECCDAWVTHILPKQRRGYAEALMETVLFIAQTRKPFPAGASGFGQVTLLKRRFQMITQGSQYHQLPWTARISFVLASLVVLPLYADTDDNLPNATQMALSASPEVEEPITTESSSTRQPTADTSSLDIDKPETLLRASSSNVPRGQFVKGDDERLKALEKKVDMLLHERENSEDTLISYPRNRLSKRAPVQGMGGIETPRFLPSSGDSDPTLVELEANSLSVEGRLQRDLDAVKRERAQLESNSKQLSQQMKLLQLQAEQLSLYLQSLNEREIQLQDTLDVLLNSNEKPGSVKNAKIHQARLSQLSQIVSELKGIASAKVTLDEYKHEDHNVRVTRPTVAVVQSGWQANIGKDMVQKIQRIVAGAFAEIEPDEVVVVNSSRNGSRY